MMPTPMDDKWIEDIRNKMGAYEIMPPDGLFESVNDEIKSRSVRRRWIFTGVAASIALFGGVFLSLIPEDINHADALVLSISNCGIPEESEEAMKCIHSENSFLYNEKTTSSRVGADKYASSKIESVAENLNAESGFQTIDEINENDDLKVSPQDENITTSDYEDSSILVNSDKKMASEESKIKLGFATSANGIGGLIGNNTVGDNLSQHPSSSIPLTRMGGGLLSDYYANNQPDPNFIEVFDHKLPIRVSADIAWPLTHNIDLGTGITYSFLKSDISFGYSNSMLHKAVQKLHFIGIPLDIRYTPWRFKQFDIYVSGGIMAEKCIAGGIKEYNNEYGDYSYDGSEERPFQFSVNASAGIQLRLARQCGLFIEPGIGIYLDNGSKLRSIYTEKPVTFNINLGIRFKSSD